MCKIYKRRPGLIWEEAGRGLGEEPGNLLCTLHKETEPLHFEDQAEWQADRLLCTLHKKGEMLQNRSESPYGRFRVWEYNLSSFIRNGLNEAFSRFYGHFTVERKV